MVIDYDVIRKRADAKYGTNKESFAKRAANHTTTKSTFNLSRVTGLNNPVRVIDRVSGGVTAFQEEKKRKQQEVQQEQPRKANLVDLTIGSVKRGYASSQRGKEAYKQMMGRENKLEEYTGLLEGDEYNFEAKGTLSKGVSGAAEMLGQQLRQ